MIHRIDSKQFGSRFNKKKKFKIDSESILYNSEIKEDKNYSQDRF